MKNINQIIELGHIQCSKLTVDAPIEGGGTEKVL